MLYPMWITALLVSLLVGEPSLSWFIAGFAGLVVVVDAVTVVQAAAMVYRARDRSRVFPRTPVFMGALVVARWVLRRRQRR